MKHANLQGVDTSEVLRDLDAAIHDIQRAKAQLNALCRRAPEAGSHRTGHDEKAAVRSYLRNRRLREDLMPQELFGEPAWDMLLDLYAAELEGRKVSVSSACVASAVPATTALRWLSTLLEFELIARAPDRSDARRTNLELTARARISLRKWIHAALLHGDAGISEEARPSLAPHD